MKYLPLLLLLSINVHADDTLVVPFLSLGAYHRDCSISDRILCDNYEIGSDTPGTIDFGLKAKYCYKWWCLWADQMDVGLFHQSYVDRGQSHHFGGDSPESYMNMYGARFTWEFNSLQFHVPF